MIFEPLVWLECGRVLGTTLEFLDGIPLVTYIGIELRYSECSNDGNKDDKFDGLLI